MAIKTTVESVKKILPTSKQSKQPFLREIVFVGTMSVATKTLLFCGFWGSK